MSRDGILKDKLRELYTRCNAGIKFGLDVERALLAALGNPQDKYAVVHVAGTNGKGSVCALVSSVLRQAGLMTGMYISPHLAEFNERMAVNGVYVADDELLELAGLVDAAIPAVTESCGRGPTFFEYATAMAFKFFEIKKVQIAVVETGMGGRLDATNVAVPLVSVVTRISIEHTEFLGSDLPAIAGEKAGIIKPSRPVVCGAMPEEAKLVVRAKAEEGGCLFRDVEDTVSASLSAMSLKGSTVNVSTESRSYGRLSTKLIGLHQVENLATAVAVIEELERALGVSFGEECVKLGVAAAEWRGRFDVLSEDPPFIVDGAHNPGAARVLSDTLVKLLKGRPLGLVIGMCSDKDLTEFIKSFRGVSRAWAVSMKNDRAMAADELSMRVNALGLKCRAAVVSEAIAEAEVWAQEIDGAVCVAGSLFLAGEVLELKGIL